VPLHEIDGYHLVRCPSCSLVYVGDPPAEERLPELYSEAYFEVPATPGYDGYGAAEARKFEHYRGLLDTIERLAPNRGDLLEIGSAYGYFLVQAQARGWRVLGVEPSSHAVHEARQRFGHATHEGTLETLRRAPESFDAVVLWDVIEHLPHPARTLVHAIALLRPGGLLALSTGDIGSLSARFHGKEWSLLTPPWHLFYFSRSTLAALVVRAGFRIERTGGDGVVALDPATSRPRLPASIGQVLRLPWLVRVLRLLGMGMTVYLYARKPNSP
jgi:SAM-dependent methyltransferase